MKNILYNIVRILTYVVAVINVVLAVTLAVGFDQDKLDKYNMVCSIKENNIQMLDDLGAANIENLPEFVDKYSSETDTLATILKAKQLQKNICYTYLKELQDLNEETFPVYKEKFNTHSMALFAKADNAQAYIDGFTKVEKYEQLNDYLSSLKLQYSKVKLEYLDQKTSLKSQTALLLKAQEISQGINKDKKETDLRNLQAEVKTHSRNEVLLNYLMLITYALFFFALISALCFAVRTIVVKRAYKTLLVIVAFVIFVDLCIMLAPSRVDGYLYLCYTTLGGAVCAVLYDAFSRLPRKIMNKVQ